MHFYASNPRFDFGIDARNRRNDLFAYPLGTTNTNEHSVGDVLSWIPLRIIVIASRAYDGVFHQADQVSLSRTTWVLHYVIS